VTNEWRLYRTGLTPSTPPSGPAELSVLFTEQPGIFGRTSADRQLLPAVLREIDAGGREVLRRALPLEVEAYGTALALHAGRVFVAGQGSMARDHQAR
jgi:hypothetical protein